ncbi:MAG: AAA family ATPase [Paludibacter sp.]
MIQELKISNFLSFKEEVTFSFEATKDTTFEEYQVVEVVPEVRLLRFAMIYGANASGKSNLLNAIEYLHNFWFDIKKDITEETDVIPFKLDKVTPNLPSVFSLKFYVKDIKYWYTLELDEHKVISEKLYYYSSAQPTLLFDRGLKNNISVITFNSTAIKVSAVAREEINIKCLPNMSFFAARNQVNVALPKIDEAREWMKDGIMQVITPKTNLFDYAERKIQEDDELKTHLLEFIKEADFNITGFDTKIIKQEVPQDFLDYILKSDTVPEDEKERLKKEKNLPQLKTDFEHTVKNERGTEKYYLEDGLQSDGTRQITGLESAIYSALIRESLLVVDEIESSLHPDLIMFILKKFLEKKDNQAQLLITTHYDPLLNEVGELFRKDAVWFTEKNDAGATELYSLVEFSGLNRIASLQKAYRQGRFGGIPKINL